MAIVEALNVFKNSQNISKALFLNVMLIISGCDSSNKQASDNFWKDLKDLEIEEYNIIKEHIPEKIKYMREQYVFFQLDTIDVFLKHTLFIERRIKILNDLEKLLNKYEELKLLDNPENIEKYINLAEEYDVEYYGLNLGLFAYLSEYGDFKDVRDSLYNINLQKLREKKEAILEKNKKSTEHKNNMIKYNKEIEELKKEIEEVGEDLKKTRDERKRTQGFLDSLKKN